MDTKLCCLGPNRLNKLILGKKHISKLEPIGLKLKTCVLALPYSVKLFAAAFQTQSSKSFDKGKVTFSTELCEAQWSIKFEEFQAIGAKIL